MSFLIDTHCHLEMLKDLPGALGHAPALGVRKMITIGTRWSRASEQLALPAQGTGEVEIYCAIGTHPDHIGEEKLPSHEDMLALLAHPSVVGVGETGLDYFHGGGEVREAQKESFRRHIAASRALGLPLIIHSREADEDMREILTEETGKGAFPFLLHCFAGSGALADTALGLGGYLSFSGLLTFPKCGIIRRVAREAPVDRILVETDSPFLTPVPFRGKPNQPGFARYTAERLAQERDVSFEEIAARTTENALRLFSKMNPGGAAA